MCFLIRLIVEMSERVLCQKEAVPALSEGGGDGLIPANCCQVGIMAQQCFNTSQKSRFYVKYFGF